MYRRGQQGWNLVEALQWDDLLPSEAESHQWALALLGPEAIGVRDLEDLVS